MLPLPLLLLLLLLYPQVRMFNEAELQMLISGSEEAEGLDVDDLAAHANYAGGWCMGGSPHSTRRPDAHMTVT